MDVGLSICIFVSYMMMCFGEICNNFTNIEQQLTSTGSSLELVIHMETETVRQEIIILKSHFYFTAAFIFNNHCFVFIY